MRHVRLGRTGLPVSRLCLGTMTFGLQCDEPASRAILDRAAEGGITFLDTADVYPLGGTPETVGRTEEILGRWLRGRRHEFIVATKCSGATGSRSWDRGLSRKHILDAIDASLKRLQTDYVDLYQFHHIDRNTPWEEIWQAIEVAVQAGKILYAGSSNFAGWHIADAQAAAARRNLMGLVSEQSLYNLLVRDIELEVVPAAERYGLGIIPWSPLQGGLLGGVIQKENTGVRRLEGRAAQSLVEHRDEIQAYEDLAEEVGVEPGTLGLAWLLTRPAVTAPIIGPRTRDQLDSALSAVELSLSPEHLRRLDEIFPGRKTAPEDYAW
jgi:aryl-alcohol dehydrogenase-like predicted oxidoreductase